MDYLPLFVDLKGRSVLVVGGGFIAARKIKLLNRVGAHVRVVANHLCSELYIKHKRKEVEWLSTEFEPMQIKNVFLVLSATNDAELNSKIFNIATKYKKLVNVVDDKSRCNFIFPSVLDRSPIIVAISSGGTAPVLTRLLREKLESLFSFSLGQVAEIAGEWREKIKRRFSCVLDRRHFWERIFNGLFVSAIEKGNIDEAKCIIEKELQESSPSRGEIFLVGAGPGDIGLLTLRALQVMQFADVVLYDNLVSNEILDLVRRDAVCICVGKRVNKVSMSQKEINHLMVQLAREGKRVVRLKSGDSFVFGRGAEELEEANVAGISFQVVPGITAAIGVTAYAGIPLTHRDYSQSVIFISGNYSSMKESINWSLLANPHQTLVIYMGVLKVEKIKSKLVNHGCAIGTPVAVIGCGTRKNQKVLVGILENLEILVKSVSPPVLIVIGEVVSLQKKLVWFKKFKCQENFRTYYFQWSMKKNYESKRTFLLRSVRGRKYTYYSRSCGGI